MLPSAPWSTGRAYREQQYFNLCWSDSSTALRHDALNDLALVVENDGM